MSVKINTENQLGVISSEDWMKRALKLAVRSFDYPGRSKGSRKINGRRRH